MLVYHFVDPELGIETLLENRGLEEERGFDFEIGS